MAVPDRRTLTVLACLVAAMTLASALLLALEPGPVSPTPAISLYSLDRFGSATPEQVLFDTSVAAKPGRWSAIVIHDSGSDYGSASTIGEAHEKAGLGGLGYHFVVNNGQGNPDGQVEIGFRWRHQLVGAHSAGPGADLLNRRAIGICFIGDASKKGPSETQMREMVWLVQQLQAKFNIPSERVMVLSHSGTAPAGRLFPIAQFRQQLLQPVTP